MSFFFFFLLQTFRSTKKKKKNKKKLFLTSVRARGGESLRFLPPPRHVGRAEQLLRRFLHGVLSPVEPVRRPDDAREGPGTEGAELAELCRVARDDGQRLQRGLEEEVQGRSRLCCCMSSSATGKRGRSRASSRGRGHEDVRGDGRGSRPAVVAAKQRGKERRLLLLLLLGRGGLLLLGRGGLLLLLLLLGASGPSRLLLLLRVLS